MQQANTAAGGKAVGGRQATLDEALDEALAYRDQGAKAAELSLHTGWRLWAEAELERLAATGDSFTADHLHDVVGDPPDGEHRNGFGGIFRTAARRRRIEAVGYVQSRRPEARGRVVRVWRGTHRDRDR